MDLESSIVQPISAFVLKHGTERAGVALPGPVRDHDDFLRDGPVQTHLCTGHALDQERVDKQFETGSDVNGLTGIGMHASDTPFLRFCDDETAYASDVKDQIHNRPAGI
jgi:hypothetical protein